MKTIKKHTRVMSLILTVLMLFSVISVTVYASDYSFAYYFANDEKTEVYVTGFKGVVPADGYVEIPETVDSYTVVGIAEHTFDNLTTLKGIVIPAAVKYIDKDAFYGCTNIIDIKIKNQGEIDVDEDVFNKTQWYEDHKQDYVISGTTLVDYKGKDEIVTIPYNCTVISPGAFKNNTAIKTVYIENEVTTIGENAFAGCTNLETIVVGDKVGTLTIGANAFEGTKWLNEYPGTFAVLGTTLVKYKGNEAYVSIPNVITAIADMAFYVGEANNGIAFRVKVPLSVKVFGNDSFRLYESASAVYPEILVYEGSAAANYCEKAGIDYKFATLPGDADLDGKVTAADARYVLRLSAKLENPQVTSEVREAADISGDGNIGADDARMILRMAVNLSDYTSESLLSMPRTDYETLLTASQAVSLAKAYGCAYSKLSYQAIDSYDMNPNSRTYFNQFKTELTSQKKAVTVTYGNDTKEALDNLFDITLVDASKIDSYSCVISGGCYNIKIVLKDEKVNGADTDAVSYTEKMLPVVTTAHFTDAMKNQYWYKLSSSNVDYDMTYTGCTIEMQIDISTMMIKTMTLNMNYDFSITGKIIGIDIANAKKNGPATARRTDTVKYTNFVYYS